MSISTHINDSGVVHRARKVFVNIGGVVTSLRSIWVNDGGIVKKVFVRGFTATISSNSTDFDGAAVLNALVAAGWDGVTPIDATLVLALDIFCRATSTSTAGLTIPGLPVGSTTTIINLGKFQGKGGAAGVGGSVGLGANGSPGGPAIILQTPVSIDNGAGYILGGGGGGAGGTLVGDDCGAGKSTTSCQQGGGGGGGGAGTGPGGTGFGTPSNNGSPGTNINTTGAQGSGGPGRTNTCCGADTSSEAGAAGGDWGAAGSNTAGRTGGAAGLAVKTNGHAVIWLAGNDPSRVKGGVSP